MKSQKSLVFLSVLVAMTLISLVSANLASVITTEFNGVTLSPGVDLVIDNKAEVEVVFTAGENASDVKVDVELFGESDSVSVGNIIEGKTYRKVLSLGALSGIDELTEEYTVYVKVHNKNDKTEVSYKVTIQRESYEVSFLSADFSSRVEAGKVFPISVVLENTGYNDLNNLYVEVGIPELSVSTRAYVGDVVSMDNDDKDNAKEVVLFLEVPEKAKAGTYAVLIKAYDKKGNVETLASKLVSVVETTTTNIVIPTKNQDLTAGKATYEIIVVNNGNDVKVFPLTTMSGSSLEVNAPTLLTIPPKSSEIVELVVTQSKDAKVGTYTFTTTIDGKQLVFTANVVGTTTMSGSVITLLVVLSIVFVVLLVVLVVLISKKDKVSEEVETSYY